MQTKTEKQLFYGGMSQDEYLGNETQFFDCENIDIFSNAKTVSLAKMRSESVINERSYGNIVASLNKYVFTRDGYVEDLFYNECSYKNNGFTSTSPAISTPVRKPIYKDENGSTNSGKKYEGLYVQNNSSYDYDIVNAISMNYTNLYGNSYFFVARNGWLDMYLGNLESTLYFSTGDHPEDNGEWTLGTGREWTSGGAQHTGNSTSPLRRTKTSTYSDDILIVSYGVRNWTKGTLSSYVDYSCKVFQWNTEYKYWRSESPEPKTNQLIINGNAKRDRLIEKFTIAGVNLSSGFTVNFIPSTDFDGEIFFFVCNIVGNRNPYLDNTNLIRFKYFKLKNSNSYPMIIYGNTLFIGSREYIQKFTIQKLDPTNEYSNIQLIHEDTDLYDIHIGIGMDIIHITRTGSILCIYANKGKNAYQLRIDGGNTSSGIQEIKELENFNFTAVESDGQQDYITGVGKGIHYLFVSSGGNRQMLYSSAIENNGIYARENMKFLFGGKIFERGRGILISSPNSTFYELNGYNAALPKGIVKYSLDKKIENNYRTNPYNIVFGNIDSYYGNQIFYSRNNKNYHIILYEKEINNHVPYKKEGYLTLHTLLNTYNDEKELFGVDIGYFLPNNQCKIELWAKVDDYRYRTVYVNNLTTTNIGDVTIQNIQGDYVMKFIEKELDEHGNGWITRKLEGDLTNIYANFGNIVPVDEGYDTIPNGTILHLDNYKRIITYTKSDGDSGFKQGAKHGTTALTNLQKILGNRHKLSLRVKLFGSSYISPEIYSVNLIYNQKDNV